MRKLTVLVMTLGLTAVCFSQAASQPLSQAFVAVNITVLPYAELNIPVDKLVMNPVTGDMFEAGIINGETRKSLASTGLEVITNTSARLEVPLMVILSGDGSYEAEVDVSGWGENVNYMQEPPFQYIDLGAGSHDLTLQVKIDKVWTVADKAGTYTGTITLNIYTL